MPFSSTIFNGHGYSLLLPANPSYGIGIHGICYPAADPTRDGYWVRASEPAVIGREIVWYCGENPLAIFGLPTDPRCEMVKSAGAWDDPGLQFIDLVFG